jgi:type IV pilus biogenesis protein PilP
MNSRLKRTALGAALAVVIGSAFWLDGGEQDAPSRSGKTRTASAGAAMARTATAPATPRLELEKLERPVHAAPAGDVFQLPEPPRSAETVMKATAPPLPFTFFGRVVDSGETRVFLSRGDMTYTVAVGDKLDGGYRVEKITANAVVLRYLPMNVTQTLDIGAIQ